MTASGPAVDIAQPTLGVVGAFRTTIPRGYTDMHIFRGQPPHTASAGRPARARRPLSSFGRSGTALGAVLLTASLALVGCGSAGKSGDESAAGRDPAHQPVDAGTTAGTSGSGSDAGSDTADSSGAGAGKTGSSASKRSGSTQLTGVHIVRTASLAVQVKDVPKAIDKARSAAEDAGGIVGDETTDRDGDGYDRSELVLRVPQERYEDVLDALAGTGKLISRTVKAEDVTDQVVDVDSRVKSQRASVDRVRKLMDQATDLSDVVSLEGELSTREADLESLLAQQASLKDRTSLATITLSLTESTDKEAGGKAHDGTGFLDALSDGWHGLRTLLSWIAIAVGACLPFAVPLGLLLVGWLRVVRPRRAARRLRLSGAGLALSQAAHGTGIPGKEQQPGEPLAGQPGSGSEGGQPPGEGDGTTVTP